MGGEHLMCKFFKISTELYDGIRLNIDQALYDKYIATQKLDYILYSNPDLVYEEYVYFSLPEYIYSDPLIESYIDQLTEITESEYSNMVNNISEM